MTGWAPKRFWTAARVEPGPDGYAILLDTRQVKTPAKAPLVVPSKALAEAIAAEWDAQTGTIDPRSMPLTRAANAAIDKVTPQHDEVAELLAAYGESDLLCYRAEGPAALVARQASAWDPLLDWADKALGARLATTTGIVHLEQPAGAVEKLRATVKGLDPWRMTALHEFVGISGSLVIGLAALEQVWPADVLWSLSRIDEDWQAEVWGQDEEAAANAAKKKSDFLSASRYLTLLLSR